MTLTSLTPKRTKGTEHLKLPAYPVENVKKNNPREKRYYGANATNRPLPWRNKLARQIGPQVLDEQYNITEIGQAGAQDLN